MLQRAASNAYSWWWASHIRTKQSKWLDQNLQDMEDNVRHALKLIEEDGDSFAKRAEMYYKKRPELINFVEESYRAYRALAERYDHLSKELQNANTTIATVFPEQFQVAMHDDEEDGGGSSKIPNNRQQFPETNMQNIPKVPKAPVGDSKGLVAMASKQFRAKKSLETDDKNKNVPKSGFSKSEALEEMDKLHKDILALQTVKEFVKSSYESGLAKYWGIENQITEMQQRVSMLQDEFGVSKVIEDDAARTLMAEAALKSCQEMLAQLQEKQERCTEEAREEYKKIEQVRNRIKSLRLEFLHDENEKDGSSNESRSSKEGSDQTRERYEIEQVQEKIKQEFEVGSLASLTVTGLVEKIDELVSKVISLETAVVSQTVLVDRLRTEANDLQAQIQSLEDDKASLVGNAQNSSIKVREMEKKLQGIQNINEDVENQNINLRVEFAEVHSNLDHLSEKLTGVELDDEPEAAMSSEVPSVRDSEIVSGKEQEMQKENTSSSDRHKRKNVPESNEITDRITEQGPSEPTADQEESKGFNIKPAEFQEHTPLENLDQKSSRQAGESLGSETAMQSSPQEAETFSEAQMENEDEVDWQHLLQGGLEDREKILLKEYTTTLRNYKEVKKNLSEMEKNEKDKQFETTLQIRELKDALSRRDEEVEKLRQMLNRLQKSSDDSKGLKEEDQQILNASSDREDAEDLLVNKQEEVIKLVLIDKSSAISPVEEKLRMDIDAILDENLDFWLRFSSAFHQIQKFKTTVQDLQNEISKLKEKRTQDSDIKKDLKSEAWAIYKHLKEIQTELSVWLEQSVLLKDELKQRFSSLCDIQEKITQALRDGVEEDKIRFSSHQAAKFQGEVLNMKQENNKVSEELQAGLDHVTALQIEVEATLRKLDEEYGMSGNQAQLRHPRIPLRSFIFGDRPKKHKNSIFYFPVYRIVGNTRR